MCTERVCLLSLCLFFLHRHDDVTPSWFRALEFRALESHVLRVPNGNGMKKWSSPSSLQFLGMDTALLKLMPDLRSLKQPTYRMLRKKMQIFEKACQARGQPVVTEAALMMLNSLEGDNWLAMEDVSLDRFDTMKAFDEFYKVFLTRLSVRS